PIPMRPSRLVTYASLTLLVLIWGTTWAAIRVGLAGIPPLAGVALRFGLAAAVLLLLTPFFGVRLGRDPMERRLWVANAVLTFCTSYGILYWAEQWVPSGLAAVLFATFPLMVALFAHLLLPGERLTAAGSVGILAGFAGVAVIFSEDFSRLGGPHVGKAAAILLLSPLTSALGAVSVKRWGKEVHPLSITAVPMAITALVMGGMAAVFERGRPLVLARPALLALLYLALVGSAVSFTLYFWLLARLPATALSLINYVIPVVAVGVGTLWLHEPLTPRIVAGAALVIVGVALALQARR
ncbi:MAG TPA: DMT family transporter, partial [Thermoanaerobaculia bacterium]|nr:DMT family transporter [Thermoanaerobaculia bacterium]